MSPIKKLTLGAGMGLLCAALSSPQLAAAEKTRKQKTTETSEDSAGMKEAIRFERHKLAAAAAQERKERAAASGTTARKSKRKTATEADRDKK